MIALSSINAQHISAPPSCVAFCPERPDLLVIGTYVLDDQKDKAGSRTQSRTGGLILLEIAEDELTTLQNVAPGPAVLDIEWNPQLRANLLAVACSAGLLQFWRLSPEKELYRQASLRVSSLSNLLLDVVWHPTQWNTLGITLSEGDVVLCRIDGEPATWTDSTSFTLQTITQHELEPWTLAFSLDGKSILSGGDDAILQCTSLEDEPVILWKDRKTHLAGVTAILPVTNTLFVTGSYDEHIRLFYRPPSGRLSVIADTNLGGGVWRLKLLESAVPTDEQAGSIRSGDGDHGRFIFLASCMHSGARIGTLEKHKLSESDREGESEWRFTIAARFEEHQSMNYASDIRPVKGGEQMRTFVSTSFYDKLVCVWQYKGATVGQDLV